MTFAIHQWHESFLVTFLAQCLHGQYSGEGIVGSALDIMTFLHIRQLMTVLVHYMMKSTEAPFCEEM
jgi:hypothetical protein